MSGSGPATKAVARPALGAAVALGATALLSARLFAFVSRHAVNVLYYDQWDFWEGLFQGQGLWQLFRWQHGLHRQGLGYLLIAACARLSGWDSRVESFAIGALLVIAAGLALLLARLLRGSWSVFDLCIPLLVLSLAHFEILIGTLNPAYGPMPLLCVLAYVLAFQIERPLLRLGALLLLGFGATYTGYGFFLGPLSVAVLALLLAGAARRREGVALHAAALALSILSLATFFCGYRLVSEPAPPARPPLADYLQYLNILFLRPFELQDVRPLKMGLGFPFVLGALALGAWSGWRSLRSRGSSRLHLTLFTLSAFSLLFAVNVAAGRAPLGVGQAASSRYLSYLVPVVLAGYLALSLAPLRPRWKSALLLLLAAGLLAKEARAFDHGAVWIAKFSEGKQRWKACFLREGDVARCDAEAGFQIYEAPYVSDRLRWKLDYLRQHQLNLFEPER